MPLRPVLLVAAALILALATFNALQTSRFIGRAASRPGVVTRLNAGGSHPQISFNTQDGTLVSYPQGGMIIGFTVGQHVQVLFEPANPKGTARVRSFGSLWGSSMALVVCGSFLLALALANALVPSLLFRR